MTAARDECRRQTSSFSKGRAPPEPGNEIGLESSVSQRLGRAVKYGVLPSFSRA